MQVKFLKYLLNIPCEVFTSMCTFDTPETQELVMEVPVAVNPVTLDCNKRVSKPLGAPAVESEGDSRVLALLVFQNGLEIVDCSFVSFSDPCCYCRGRGESK